MKDYVLKPYELILCKVPNDHENDPVEKRRPVVILDPMYDESDFENEDFSLKDVYPIFLHGTSKVDKYKDRDDFVYFDSDEIKDTKLRRPTGFIVNERRLAKNDSKNWSAYDVIHNSEFQSLGVLPDELKEKLKSFIVGSGVNVALYESFSNALNEAKADHDAFIAKFGKDVYDLFLKSKDRLKNANVSTDMVWHTKNTSVEDMKNMLYNLRAKVSVNKDEKGADLTKIPGKYKFLGSKDGYDVYEPLDVEASMALGVGSGWCTTGRYGHAGDVNFKPSLKDAKKHWDEYIEDDIRFFYFLKNGIGKYAIALYPYTIHVDRTIGDYYIDKTNFEIFNQNDEQDYEAVPSLPLDILKSVGVDIEYVVAKTVDGLYIKDDVLLKAKKDIEEAKIPDSVTTIGMFAFDDCYSLKSITIPNSVTTIRNFAFKGCYSLKSIVIPNSVISIGHRAFSDCSVLKSIIIPNGVTTIGEGAFYNCASLTSVIIPDSVTFIGGGAFCGCSSLTSVTISDSVTHIEYYTFYGCSSLTSVTIPDSVTIIERDAFKYCFSLKSIIIPNSVKSIDYGAFDECNNLRVIIDSDVAKKYFESNYPDVEIVSNDVNESIEKTSDSLSERIYDFIEDLYDLRKDSIANDGEYGTGNLVFKEFRNLGYLDNLKELGKKAKSKELSLENLDEALDKAKPYMVRNDGAVLECGDVHPYLNYYYEEGALQGIGRLLGGDHGRQGMGFVKWFYDNTNVEKTREGLCTLIVSLANYKGSIHTEIVEEAKELIDELNLNKDCTTLTDISQICDLFIELNNATNQEFMRMRTSDRIYGGHNDDIYFRIGSVHFNWFPIIWDIVAKNKKQDTKVTISRDPQATGDRDVYKIHGEYVLMMPADEFLTLQGNIVIESFSSSSKLVNEAMDMLKDGESFFAAFDGSQPRYANGFFDMAIREGIVKWDLNNLLRESERKEKKETENEKLFWNVRDDSNDVAVALLDIHNGNNIWYNEAIDKIESVPNELVANGFSVSCEQTRDDVTMTKEELLRFKDEVDGKAIVFFDDRDNIWGGEYSAITMDENKAREACIKYGQDGYAFFDENGDYAGTKDKDGNVID